jgi:hypothetical protein
MLKVYPRYLLLMLTTALTLYFSDGYTQCSGTPPTPVINGQFSVCAGTEVTYTTTAGKQDYIWNYIPTDENIQHPIPTATLVSGGNGFNTITLRWKAGFDPFGAGRLDVSYIDPNFGSTCRVYGFAPPIRVLNANSSIQGPDALCLSQSSITGLYSVFPPSVDGLYNWNLSSGGTISGGQNTPAVSVEWTALGNHNLTVSYNFLDQMTGQICNTTVRKTVTISSVTPISISGATSACTGNVTTYSTQSGKSNYSWSVIGGTIVSGAGTNSISVNWNTAGAGRVNLSYTEIGCGQLSTSLEVTVSGASLVGPTSACVGATGITYSTASNKKNYNWTVTGGIIRSGANTNTITVDWTSPGTQTISVTFTGKVGSCTLTTPLTKNVVVTSPPQAPINGPTNVSVSSMPHRYFVQATPGSSGIQWTVSPGGQIITSPELLPTATVIEVIWNTDGAQSVAVQYNDPSGCRVSSTLSVSVTSLQILGDINPCIGAITRYSVNNPMPAFYQWLVPPGAFLVSPQGQPFADIIWNMAGPQNLSVTAQSGSSSASASLLVTVKTPTTTPTITGPSSVCNGSVGVSYSTESGKSSYQWTITGGTITSGSSTNSVMTTWNTAGSISVSYTDTNGCRVSTSKPVAISTRPTSVLSGSTTVCNGGATLSVVLTGTPPWNLTYSDGSNIMPETGIMSSPYTFTVSPTSTKTYTITALSDANCTSLSSDRIGNAIVTVAPRPMATLNSGSSSICGTNGTLLLGGTVTATGAWTLTLSNNGGIVTGTGSGTWTKSVTPMATGTYTIASLVDASCSALPTDLSGSVSVTLSQKPTANITSAGTALCSGSNTTLTGTVTAEGAWTLTLSNNGGTVTGTGSGTWSKNVTPTNTTTYTIVSLIDAKCSANSTDLTGSTTISVNQRPTASIYSNALKTICVGQQAVISGTVSATGAWTLTLSNNGGTVTGTGNGTWTKSVTPFSTTNYTIASLVDSNCAAVAAGLTGTETIYVNPSPKASITSTDVIICRGSETEISGTVTATGSWELTLSNGGGTVTGSGNGNWSKVVTPLSTTTYTITALQDAACSASSSDLTGTVTVSLLKASLAFVSGPATVCIGATGITYSTEAGMTNYNWNVSGGGSITSGQGTSSITVSWSNSGPQTVSVNYTNSIGCNAYGSLAVAVALAPQPYIAVNYDICYDGYSVLTAEYATGATGYQWFRNGTPLSFTSQEITVYTPGDYSVKAFYSGGCSAQSSPVTILRCIIRDPCPLGEKCLEQQALRGEIENELAVYPNAADRELTVLLPSVREEALTAKLYSQYGTLMSTSILESGTDKTTLNTAELAEGIYILVLENNQGKPMVQRKVIVRH